MPGQFVLLNLNSTLELQPSDLGGISSTFTSQLRIRSIWGASSVSPPLSKYKSLTLSAMLTHMLTRCCHLGAVHSAHSISVPSAMLTASYHAYMQRILVMPAICSQHPGAAPSILVVSAMLTASQYCLLCSRDPIMLTGCNNCSIPLLSAMLHEILLRSQYAGAVCYTHSIARYCQLPQC